MTATEAILSFERAATLELRVAALAVRLDTELMLGLLARLDQQSNVLHLQSKEQEATFIKASNDFIWTLKAILSDQKLGSVADRLRKTEKKHHRTIVISIEATSRDIGISRRAFDIAFKTYWLPRFLTTEEIRKSREFVVDEYPQQLANLLRAFRERPFAIGGPEDSFIKEAPSTRDDIPAYSTYQKRIKDTGIAWARAYNEEKLSLEGLMAVQNGIFTLAWGGTLAVVANIDTLSFNQPRSNFSEMPTAQIELSNKLRDSILRYHSSQHSIVFVGTENSGKSTFLNAFIGVEMLPTGGE
jgi:hypothetical protein